MTSNEDLYDFTLYVLNAPYTSITHSSISRYLRSTYIIMEIFTPIHEHNFYSHNFYVSEKAGYITSFC